MTLKSELKPSPSVGGVIQFQGSGVSDAVAAVNQARLSITCGHRRGGGAHDAADAFALADAIAVGGGRRTTTRARRRRQLLVGGGWPFDAVLEAADVAGVNAGVLPALGVARLVAAAELGHGRHLPIS